MTNPYIVLSPLLSLAPFIGSKTCFFACPKADRVASVMKTKFSSATEIRSNPTNSSVPPISLSMDTVLDGWTDDAVNQVTDVPFLEIWIHIIRMTGGSWSGRRFHLSSNEKVFNTETFAIYRTLRIFDERQEAGRRYTVFLDSQGTIQRIRTDAVGPSQH